MSELAVDIPLGVIFAVLAIRLLTIPYDKHKEQVQKMRNLRETLKFKNSKQISVETDEQYSAELLYIANEVKIILAVVGDKLDELLTNKAAKYLVFRAICKNNVVDNNIARYFKGRNRAFFNFINWLEGPLHKPEGLDDNSIGKYCTILFLIFSLAKSCRALYHASQKIPLWRYIGDILTIC